MQPKHVFESLDMLFRAKIPVMFWGPPGVGKSAMVREAGKYGVGRDDREPREVLDIRLALLDPTDLRGIPYYNPDVGTAEWAPASILPSDPNSKAILFLDEINAAPPVVQAAAYQLVLDRRIGDYVLPEGVDIVAAGNRESDKAVTFKMPTPLLNRFVHIDFEKNIDDWFDWAIKNKIHPSVISYLNWKKSDFFKFDPQSKDRAFATPRTWEYASKLLYQADQIGADDKQTQELIGGAIGEGLALELMTHRKLADKLPDPMDILSGKVTSLKDDLDISARYSMMIALVTRLGSEYEKLVNEEGESEAKSELCKKDGMADHFLLFIDKNFDTEYCIMGVRYCMKTLLLPLAKSPAFKQFTSRYGQLIIEA